MSLATRCPACGTTFRVHSAQLSARAGKVRCGKCAAVFDGIASLVEETERLALDPSPQLGLFDPSRRSQPSPRGRDTSTAAEEPLPEFMAREAPRARRRWVWGALALLAALALAAQAAYVYRADLAAQVPEARAPLEAACRALGCTIPLPRYPELMSIDSSELQADPRRRGVIILDAVLRNRAGFAQAYPALELTLTDAGERPVARRVLMPSDYLARERAAQRVLGIPPGGTAALRVYLDTGATNATGYRLYLFYPS